MLLSMVHKVNIGYIEVTSLGIATTARTPAQIGEIFPDVPEEQLIPALSSAYPDEPLWSYNAALIRIGDQQILVDTGFGFTEGGPGKPMLSLLADAGTGPEEITTIVITHGHGDHIGGLLNDGAASFPNAELAVSKAEYEHWMSGNDSPQKAGFSAYSDRTRILDGDAVVSKSGSGDTVKVIQASGHTPGHIGLEVLSDSQCFWLLVDVAHSLIQLEHPEWNPSYDSAPEVAQATRLRIFTRAAERSIPVLMYHFPFPGIGVIAKKDGAFAYTPS